MKFKYQHCWEAASAGDLECLKHLHESGCRWDKNTTAFASKGGYLNCLKYAYEHGCPWDKLTTSWAAIKGHTDCLIYAHENGCEWNRYTTSFAAEHGNLTCLVYAHENGCAWDEMTTANAARYGHMNCLIYAHENGCPWNWKIPALAAENDQLECLKYAHENGCEWDENVIINAIRKCSNSCLEYATKFNCPTNIPVINFIKKGEQYIKSLSSQDHAAIDMYTGNYFFRAINAKEQDLLNTDLLPSNWYEDVNYYCEIVNYKFSPQTAPFSEFINFLSHLIDHINKIIENAPELTEEITVYRGVKTPYFLNSPDNSFVHKGFLSTTLCKDIAKGFSKKDDNLQYMLESKLKIGTRCIYYDAEKEVILPINTKLIIKKKIDNKAYQGYYEVEYTQ